MEPEKRIRPKYRYPWRSGNDFRVLVDGEQFFEAMLDSVDRASSYVLLEMYLVSSGKVATRFIQALLRARARDVDVYLLLDGYGARGLGRDDRRQLTAAGARLHVYNPLRYGRLRRNFFRDHRKLLLVDGRVAYTGGLGITDAFAEGPGKLDHWHELVVQIQGPGVADWQSLFEETWNRTAAEALQLPTALPAPPGDQSGRLVTSRANAQSEIMRSAINRVRGANRRVWLATAYFVPSWKLRRALRKAAHRGADVRLILPGPLTDHPWARHVSRRYYERLLANRVRIFEYLPRFMHAKLLVCDDWASIGSSNMDRWNFVWNLEANQEIADRDFADAATAILEEDTAHCREFSYEHWRKRPWYRHLREWYWGRVAAFLAWYSLRRRRRR